MRLFRHRNSSSRRGFTLPQVLAAMAFLAIVLPTAIQGILIASRAGMVAERKRTAASLADPMLTGLIATGDWLDSADEGDFGEEWPGYRWELGAEPWEEDTVYQVDLSVFYMAQGKEYSVTLSTLAENAP